MENKKNNVKLGAFIAIGMLLLLFGIYLIGKKQQLFNSTFVISSVFKDINGLQIGSNVRFAGINVGVVENITIIADTAVQIDMFINYSIKKFIKKDAKAIIGTDGLMGNKIVTLLAGSANEKEIKENPPINEKMIRAMFLQMGRKPSEAQIRQIMKSVNANRK